MGIYSEGMTAHLEGVGRAMAKASDPHHRAILANYQQHLALEQGGRYEEIFARGLIVDHPVYKVGFLGKEELLDGADAVKGWYGSMKHMVALLLNEKIAVDDWGFASYADLIEFVPGDQLAGRGIEVEDTSSLYLLKSNQAMFWLYNDDALLEGERLWVVNEPTVELADPSDLMTKPLMIEQCEPYFEGARLPA
jgi:hypothetical protein